MTRGTDELPQLTVGVAPPVQGFKTIVQASSGVQQAVGNAPQTPRGTRTKPVFDQ